MTHMRNQIASAKTEPDLVSDNTSIHKVRQGFDQHKEELKEQV